MYCRNCGSYNSDDAKFCHNCGQKLTFSVQNTEAPENTGSINNTENNAGMNNAQNNPGKNNAGNTPGMNNTGMNNAGMNNPGNTFGIDNAGNNAGMNNTANTFGMNNAQNNAGMNNTGNNAGMNNYSYGGAAPYAPPVPPVPPAPPVYRQPAYGYSQQNRRPNPLYPILRKHASSGIFLAGSILFIVSILLIAVNNIIVIINPAMGLDGIIERLHRFLPLAAQQFTGVFQPSYSYMRHVFYYPIAPGTVLLMIGSLVSMVPPLLAFIGMLTVRSDAEKSKKTGGFMRTNGFSLIKGVNIYMLVILCLAAAALLIVFLIASVASLIADDPGLGALSMGATLALIAFLIVIAVFEIVFVAKVIKMLNGFRRFAAGGAAYTNVSMFVIVFGFITAGVELLSSAAMLFVSPIGFIAYLLNALAFILILIALCRYRSEINRALIARNTQQPLY